MMMYFSTFIWAASLFKLSIAGYALEDDYMTDFYGSFDFFTDTDPTNGFVKYVDETTAKSTGLINETATAPISFGVDHENVTPEGRPSIRLQGKKKYNSGLVVLDVEHMPSGCGTWPAFWMVGPDWPTGGEIDIIEGVNDQENNGITLHTGPGCEISQSTHGLFSGEVDTPNCDVDAEGQDKNKGCSIRHPSKQSYGRGLNDNGGGVYATEWAADAINVYFFPRGSIPEDVLGDNPDPSGWGKPSASFTGGCDIPKTFKDNQIVIDTTFCGDWAGRIWESGSCASKAPTCNDYVENNPQAFAEAHWTINALRVYQDNGESPASSEPVSPPQSTVISQPVGEPSQTQGYPIETPHLAPIIAPTGDSGGNAALPSIGAGSSIISAPPAADATAAPSAPAESASPSQNTQDAAPTDNVQNGPMSGFVWPNGDGESQQPGDGPAGNASSSAPAASSAPTSNSTGPVPVPTNTATIPIPSAPVPQDSSAAQAPPAQETPAPPAAGETSAPPSSSPPAAAEDAPAPTSAPAAAPPPPPAASDVADDIETVYETVYLTVPAADAPAATPAPNEGAAARRARHVREHRRRMTRHNAGR